MVRHAHRPVAGVARRSAPLLLSFALGLFPASCGSSTSAEQPIGPDAGDRTTADAQGDAHDAVTEDASGGATDVGEADDAGEADTADTSAPEPGLELEPGEAPFDLPAGAVFYPDVTYGPHGERSLLDVLVPDSETPPPLVVFIHGGGFTSGSKEKLYENDATNARAFLERGVAVAAINYRYLGAAEGVLGCMNDSLRCSFSAITRTPSASTRRAWCSTAAQLARARACGSARVTRWRTRTPRTRWSA